MTRPEDPIGEARRLGTLEAESFDAGLRARERREREDRMSRAVVGADEEGHHPCGPPREVSMMVWQLQRDVERLGAFHHAVLHSRAWRLVQLLRRPFGRAW